MLKKNVGYLGLCAMLLFAAGCQQKNLSPVERGETYFKGFGCVKCHSVGESLGGSYGPDLTYVGFRKDEKWLDQWLKDPHGWRGKTVMPNFHFPEPVRSALVAYCVSLKGQGYRPGHRPWEREEWAADPVKKGEVIFMTVGCVTCHGHGGKGGYPNNNVVGGAIPALTKVSDAYTKEELKERIEDGSVPASADPKQPAPLIRMPAWKEKLTDQEIEAVVEYLFSLKPKSAGAQGEEW